MIRFVFKHSIVPLSDSDVVDNDTGNNIIYVASQLANAKYLVIVMLNSAFNNFIEYTVYIYTHTFVYLVVCVCVCTYASMHVCLTRPVKINHVTHKNPPILF